MNILARLFAQNFFYHPIFIVGAGRSGTSVLLQALGKHPLILSAEGEAPFITTIGGAASLFECAENKQYYNDSLKVPKDYLYDDLRRLAFEVAFGKHFGFKAILKKILYREGNPLVKRFWCAKTFPSFGVTGGLLNLYRDVKFIYIVRNGCDVVQSMTKFSGFSSQNFEKNCRDWVKSAENFGYLRNHESAIMVRHEQLVEDPQKMFHDIFSFLGVGYHSGSTSYVRNTLVHPLDKPTQAAMNVQDALRTRKPSHEGWSQEQRDLFVGICGETMKILGYEIPY